MVRQLKKSAVAGVLLGLLCGLVLGFLLSLLPSVLMLYPYLIVLGTLTLMTLRLRFGLAGFWTASFGMALLLSLLLSPLLGFMALLSMTLPCEVLFRLLSKKKPLPTLMAGGMTASLLGQLFGLLLYKYLLHSNPASDFVDALVYAVRTQLPSQMLEGYAPVLETLFANGLLAAPEGYTAGQTLTGQTLMDFFCGLLQTMKTYYATKAPAAMVQSALCAGTLGIYVPMRLTARRDDPERARYTTLPPASKLRISNALSFGVLTVVLVLFILYASNKVSDAVFDAIWGGVMLLYALQGLSVLVFFFEKKKLPIAWQFVLGLIALLFLRWLLFLLGLVEQSFYLRGIGRPMIVIMRGPNDPNNPNGGNGSPFGGVGGQNRDDGDEKQDEADDEKQDDDTDRS